MAGAGRSRASRAPEDIKPAIESRPAAGKAKDRKSIRAFKRTMARQTDISTAAKQYPEAEKLYITALRHSRDVGADSHKILTTCCQQILNRYPNSPQAEKAKRLLQEARSANSKQTGATRAALAKKPPAMKSRPLRMRTRRPSLRREPPKTDELKGSGTFFGLDTTIATENLPLLSILLL